jgi:predicted HNH restriction endonuclease
MLTILWHESTAKGYIDYIPNDWIMKEGFLRGRIHSCKGPKGGMYKAKCNVTVNGSKVDLNYEPFIKYNKSNGMYLGILRILFDNKRRSNVVQVLWKDKASSDIAQVFWKDKASHDFEQASTTVIFEQETEINQPRDIKLLRATEGTKVSVYHLIRERNPRLVAAKKNAVLSSTGKLNCEICGFNFKDKYGDIGESFCEVHHRHALSKTSKCLTRLNDLAILCSNCHRMIHRTDPMLTVKKFRMTILK